MQDRLLASLMASKWDLTLAILARLLPVCLAQSLEPNSYARWLILVSTHHER